MKKLTAISLTTLPEGDYPDPLVPGLTFRVGKKRRVWTLRYRIGDAQRRDILGYYLGANPPEGSEHMGLADARDSARKRLERAEAGVPIEEKPSHPKQGGKTVADIIDAYEKLRIKEGGRTKTLDHALTSVRSGLKDYLRLPATQFSKADLRAARDEIAERAPIMANRFLAYLGPIWRWAAGEDLVPMNFVRDVRKGAERKRDRVLTHDEIRAIWNACGEFETDSGRAFGRLVKFLLVTAQRRDEGASVKHGDILDGIWRQDQNKSARAHRLKLPRLALDLVGSGEAKDIVFAGESGKLGGFSKWKADLDERSKVTDWRLHDLRRTGASNMQMLGISNDVIQGVLNHAIAGVGGVYLRAELDKAKGDALEKWATALSKIVKDKQSVA